MIVVYILGCFVGAFMTVYFQGVSVLTAVIGGSIGGGVGALIMAVYHGIREK